MSLPRNDSSQTHALRHVNKWCEAQIAVIMPDPHENLRFTIPGNVFMSDSLMLQISALYPGGTWTNILSRDLLKLVPGLKGWKYREEYLTPLCIFLIDITDQVSIDWLAAQAAAQAAKKMKEDIEAKGPSPFLTLPSDIRIRIHDIIASSMHPRSGGLDRGCIQTYWNGEMDGGQDLLMVSFAQVNKQLRV
ncbi:unnamed protein product [Zymoseptoria tritici ST99CH_3D7]|uniref:Uncharacterized protein n=1 Tax=Zymoseptoria tritici (strain ST99CH_3D7) TaxID=1276538 RepID=A0A1X7S648_ZYMT9|nr:unnamed protein product [Zymoseptoria tritici ST99CH_3D7]